MHNYYTLLYNKAVYDVLAETKGEDEAILFARSATVGGQCYPVHWGGDCSSVREVDDRHAGLPLVPLPHRAVGVPDEVAQLRALFEQRRLLADVRVDPHAHLQPAVMQLREQAFGVGELRLVPLEIAPFELLHPPAVEVETDGSVWQWDKWQAGMAIVDFTNPDATAWYQGYLKKLVAMGVDCFKTDFSSPYSHGTL